MNRLKRVLVVDYHPETADTLGLLLELGSRLVRVLTAYKDSSAIELASDGHFDVVVFNLEAGGFDGVFAARSIRLQDGENCPKLVALSNREEQIAARWEKPLFDCTLDKPVSIGRLLDVIHHSLDRPPFPSHRRR